MGNCSPKGVAKAKGPNFIRIMTDSGSIMELQGPKLAGEVLREFPGYGIFGQGHVFSPLFGHEQLHCGQFFYLLPLTNEDIFETSMNEAAEQVKKTLTGGVGSVVEVLHPAEKGVWRVKLAIGAKQLEGILSEDGELESLIEQMRLAATLASATTKREKISSGKSGVDWKAVLKNQQKRVRLQGLSTIRTSQEKAANEPS